MNLTLSTSQLCEVKMFYHRNEMFGRIQVCREQECSHWVWCFGFTVVQSLFFNGITLANFHDSVGSLVLLLDEAAGAPSKTTWTLRTPPKPPSDSPLLFKHPVGKLKYQNVRLVLHMQIWKTRLFQSDLMLWRCRWFGRMSVRLLALFPSPDSDVA